MKLHVFLTHTMALGLMCTAQAQNVGINTTSPQRPLEVEGEGDQFIRIQTTTAFGSETGLELINGLFNNTKDWKVANNSGTFEIRSSDDLFNTSNLHLRINASAYVGLNGSVADAPLHIVNGSEASNTDHGYAVIGALSTINMVMDPNEINARYNGTPTGLYLQEMGGNTLIGQNGGNTYFGMGGGDVGIGTSSTPRKLSVEGTGFQIFLRNNVSGLNDWYIGASNSSWLSGDSQLLFSPGQNSNDAIFRLMDVADNDGETAPVMIRSSASQTLLLDGNEIDSKSGPLYINHNSNQNTYINPAGGLVGIGTSNPSATLHIVTPANEYALRLQVSDVTWSLHPYSASNQLGFAKDGVTVAAVNGGTGQWLALSDRRLKKDFEPMYSVLNNVIDMGLYSYNYIADPGKTRVFGVMAQEIEQIFPQVVRHDNDDEYTVSYAQLAVIALKALQEQQNEINALQTELNTLLGLTAANEQ